MDKTSTNEIKEQIAETMQKMVGFMNVDCSIEAREEIDDRNSKSIVFSIYTPENAKFLIGKNGQNLKSLEHVLRAMFVKRMTDVGNLIIDVNDYRKSRKMYVADLARQAVTRVRSTQKAEALLPMSAYERRIVHMELASCPDIATESIGEDPNRRIVVKPYP
ncbi:MAG: hypothetical protein A3B91_03900 [Candidatus Yanofskybacteria bacterium RIFCSPHIGHO2_02_FULL_41_29]|uniref:R3H domain-containing protein n=1 Tax=Candidatus Yanofskybacteria bacterium RIFCSPHIGHO2_01_FULL_41_53 TaxID=1802663 RepID=A0A1F8EFK7_9BACT|nr:MAG: hypothetical protein A2650_02625 [Candidatus Yanofskybacteria bacterium RIFCSPHIGHO2_01_FULL_41_53]OGN10896.1 MAG: hypothetical protein A3B91_03900 [Candidatus Yanofskybacteria bacterium RIFCSPHIGHO2_02_FULL_41_29]OGN19317.1 MAG: hypothetical protein A3F48_01410 [Candidatus Yanofskybacteria bacterium RIFCSPHIGHO2_12_FULL_41_9]OGN21753.1 MAG: hypothetical protein A2916_03310 [Candidatus Yanofskybacteria bacterium RIFCSPLOWO2_01_FULL_41_67]OGN29565.1 MAG: hypothetical protein A3H54_01540 